LPIKIPDGLPAREVLENENIFVMNETKAQHQDIRPLKIAVMNLMPTKITTETQLIRLLSNSSLQVELTLLSTASHTPKNTPEEHMKTFYRSLYEVINERFDGLVITGAPVEELKFEQVDYWRELCGLMEWAKTHVYSVFHICWAAQAGLYYHYGIPKYSIEKKMFGVFRHRVLNSSHPLLRGFDEIFMAPHSRHTEIREQDVRAAEALEVLAVSDEAGVYLAADRDMRKFYVTGHSEYDYNTLANEYFRDKNKGLEIDVPKNYFPDDNSDNTPLNVWRGHAHLMFSNWLNNIVYQNTPYNLNELNEMK